MDGLSVTNCFALVATLGPEFVDLTVVTMTKKLQ